MGVYRVTARNRVGHMTCRSRIRLGDTPAKPGRPVVPQVSCREAYVAWEAPDADGNSFIMSYKVRESVGTEKSTDGRTDRLNGPKDLGLDK